MDDFHSAITASASLTFPRQPISYSSLETEIDLYKHQWQVAKAVFKLRQEGCHLHLDLVGPAYSPALRQLKKVLKKYSPLSGVTYQGKAPYEQVHQSYQKADAFIFASTCETYGVVLTEAKAAGLPIACSNHSSMPETAGDSVIYFDPPNIDSIKQAIVRLYHDNDLRKKLSKKALEKARLLSWEKCADDTFAFLAEVHRKVYEF